MTPDPTLAARLAELDETRRLIGRLLTVARDNGDFIGRAELLAWGAEVLKLEALSPSVQLITLADHDAAVKAAVEVETEACALIADAYADENIRMAGDSVLFDPVLGSKKGDVLTKADFVKSDGMILDGAIHSSMFHAAQNIAAAIRARTARDAETEGER